AEEALPVAAQILGVPRGLRHQGVSLVQGGSDVARADLPEGVEPANHGVGIPRRQLRKRDSRPPGAHSGLRGAAALRRDGAGRSTRDAADEDRCSPVAARLNARQGDPPPGTPSLVRRDRRAILVPPLALPRVDGVHEIAEHLTAMRGSCEARWVTWIAE